MNPAAFTLRELLAMDEAHSRAAWDHTSHLLAFLANPHRDTKQRRTPYTPAEFHPWHQRRVFDPAAGWEILRGMAKQSIKIRPDPQPQPE